MKWLALWLLIWQVPGSHLSMATIFDDDDDDGCSLFS
jgi:hypothetical protein